MVCDLARAQIAQVLARLETDRLARRDLHFTTRPRVAPDTLLARLDLEHTEAAKLDPLPAVHRGLKSRAKAHGRSLNKEIISTLESTLHGSPIDAAAVGKHARAVRETMGVYITQKGLTTLKNAGRR